MAKPKLERTSTEVTHSEGQSGSGKWCWYHQRYEPIENFGLAKGRSDGRQPLCRLADAEYRWKNKSPEKREKYPRFMRETAPDGMKWCAFHETFCPVESFGRDRRKESGLQSSCLRAQSDLALKNKGRERNKVSKYNPAPSGKKWCSWHKQFEPVDDFYDQTISKRDPSGKSGNCRQGYREYWQANPLKAIQGVQRRRARKKSAEGSHTEFDIIRIYHDQTGRCAICAKIMEHEYTIDHIMPLSKGGSNWPRNLQLVCRPCNSRKHNLDPIDFAQRNGLLL